MFPLSITLSKNRPSNKINKNFLFALGLILAFGGLFICQGIFSQANTLLAPKTNAPGPLLNSSAAILPNPAEAQWKTYSNKEYGFEFKYPNTWTEQGKESRAINRKGEVMSVQINFADTVSNSAFFIEYHLAPYGAELFRYEKAQFDSSLGAYSKEAKQIEVAGVKAIEAFITMSSDIKGHTINPPLKIIFIHFLDKQKAGEFTLRFATPMPNNATETIKFNNLVSSIKFI